MQEQTQNIINKSDIKVIGVGGFGATFAGQMAIGDTTTIGFYAIDTDPICLKKLNSIETLRIGEGVDQQTKPGVNPDTGRKSALKSRREIESLISGTDFIILIAGLGRTTGTGALPVIVDLAKELQILTITIVIKPFAFEGKKLCFYAEKALEQIHSTSDATFVFDCNQMLKALGKGIALPDAFVAQNHNISLIVSGLTDLILRPGPVNVTCQDLQIVFADSGIAQFSSATCEGENRSSKAINQAIESATEQGFDNDAYSNITINITAGNKLPAKEFKRIANTVEQHFSRARHTRSIRENIIMGCVVDPSLEKAIRVTLFFSGQKEVYDFESEHEYLDNPPFLKRKPNSRKN